MKAYEIISVASGGAILGSLFTHFCGARASTIGACIAIYICLILESHSKKEK